jgi:hypothetical protein
MAKTEIKQLDPQGNVYAAVDERGAIIGTGTKEVCEFLTMLANYELESSNTATALSRRTKANVHSAIDI